MNLQRHPKDMFTETHVSVFTGQSESSLLCKIKTIKNQIS